MPKSLVLPAATKSLLKLIVKSSPSILLPLAKTNLNPAPHVQVPVFCIRQIFVKTVPAVSTVPSGMVTSWTNIKSAQPTAVEELPAAPPASGVLMTGVKTTRGVVEVEPVAIGARGGRVDSTPVVGRGARVDNSVGLANAAGGTA